MARIPRTEQSVRLSMADQPTMSPDALTGPGRALQGLGKALAGLGEDLSQPSDGDLLSSQLAQMDAATASQKYYTERMASLTPDTDPDTWHQDTTAGLNQIWSDNAARVPANPKLQQGYEINRHRFVGSYDVKAHETATGIKTERFATGAIETFKGALEGVDPTTPEGKAVLDTVWQQLRRVPGLDPAKAEGILADKILESIDAQAAKDPITTLEKLEGVQKSWGDELRAPPSANELPKVGPQSNLTIQPAPIARLASVGRPRSGNVSGMVIHETQGSDTAAGNLAWSNKKNTGANYYIDKSGNVIEWAPDNVAMNHAGVGRGVKGDVRPDLRNNNTLSIEIMTRPGEKPNEAQIKAAHALASAKAQEYGFTENDIEAHGRLAPGHKEATEGTSVVDYIRGNWANRTAVASSKADKPGIAADVTAYSPQKGGSKMEGGYAAAKPGPDGKAEVRTLADFASGKSKYVTVAGNPRDYGKTFTIPEISFVDAKGQRKTLKNVPAVVHDTGEAFKNAPEGRFDIPIDLDATNKQMAASHAMWKKQGVRFVPEEAAAPETPVAQRGLTQYAGLGGPKNTMTDAVDVPGLVEKGNIDLSARKVLDNKDGTISTESSFSVEIDGKEVLLPTVIDGKRVSEDAAIAHYKKTGEHLGIFSDAKSATEYANGLHKRQEQTYGRAENTIPGTKVADASGLTPQQFIQQQKDAQSRAVPGDVRQPQPQWRTPSIRTRILDALEKKIPAYVKARDAVLNGYVERAEKSAAEGYVLPNEERALIEGRLAKYGNPEQQAKYAASLGAATQTAQMKAMTPVQLEQVSNGIRADMQANGANPDTIARAKAVEGLHARMTKELTENPLGWGVESGVIASFEDITPETFGTETLARRAQDVQAVSDHFGHQYWKAFTPNEKVWMEDTVKKGGDQMISMMGSIYDAFGDNTPEVVAEIAPKNPEAVRAGYLLATGGDPKAARDIAETMKRRADPNYKGDTKIDTAAAQGDFTSVVGDFYKNLPPEEKDATMRAAEAIYMARVDDPTVYDADLFKQSVEAAMGARVSPTGIKFGGVVNTLPGRLWGTNGDPILLPSSVRQDTFREMLDGVTVQDMIDAGHPMPLDANGKPISLTKAMNGRLVTVDRGKYAVSLGDPDMPGGQKWVAMRAAVPDGLAVENAPMQRFELNLEKLIPVLRKKNPEMFTD